MNSRLLYHGFGMKGQDVRKSDYKGGSVIVHIQTRNICCVVESAGVLKSSRKARW